MSPVRRRAIVVLALLGGVATGCGVGAQEQPVPIDRKDVPFGLLRDAPDSTSSTTAKGDEGLPTGAP